jgi:hypothetical protein
VGEGLCRHARVVAVSCIEACLSDTCSLGFYGNLRKAGDRHGIADSLSEKIS